MIIANGQTRKRAREDRFLESFGPFATCTNNIKNALKQELKMWGKTILKLYKNSPQFGGSPKIIIFNC